MKRIAIVGAGGFAREVAWLIDEISTAAKEDSARLSLMGFLVSDLNRIGPYDSPVLGDFSWLDSNHVDALAIGIGTPTPRLRVAGQLTKNFPHLEWPSLVHPSVMWQRPTMRIGEGVIICAGSIAPVNARFEDFCMVNMGCTIGHEALIGRGSVINPSVNISGGVELGTGVLVGAGAQILQYVKVGDGAQIGAGAVVTRNVKPGTTVVVPPMHSIAWTPCSARELASAGGD